MCHSLLPHPIHLFHSVFTYSTPHSLIPLPHSLIPLPIHLSLFVINLFTHSNTHAHLSPSSLIHFPHTHTSPLPLSIHTLPFSPTSPHTSPHLHFPVLLFYLLFVPFNSMAAMTINTTTTCSLMQIQI